MRARYIAVMATAVEMYPKVLKAIDLISQGFTKTRACDDAGLSTTTFDKLVNGDALLAELANEAEQRGYHSLADALVTIDTSVHGSSDPKMAAILSKNIQWYLSRRNPKQYGERVTVEHTITADRAIVDALERGKQRALAAPMIEGVAREIAHDALTSDLDPAEAAELAKLI